MTPSEKLAMGGAIVVLLGGALGLLVVALSNLVVNEVKRVAATHRKLREEAAKSVALLDRIHREEAAVAGMRLSTPPIPPAHKGYPGEVRSNHDPDHFPGFDRWPPLPPRWMAEAGIDPLSTRPLTRRAGGSERPKVAFFCPIHGLRPLGSYRDGRCKEIVRQGPYPAIPALCNREVEQREIGFSAEEARRG